MASHLASWNDTSSKQAIIDFVAQVTDKSSPNYVLPEARIAVYDNDGTLWCESHAYPGRFYPASPGIDDRPGSSIAKSAGPLEGSLRKGLCVVERRYGENIIAATKAT